MTERPGWLEDFRRNFLEASLLEREHAFGLSSFAGSHFEEPPNWNVTRADVESQIKELCREYIETGRWRQKISDETKFDERLLDSWFYPGHMANRFLMWHIQDELSFRCVPEARGTSERQFDVSVTDSGTTICEVELKRVISGKQIQSYTDSFKKKYNDEGKDCKSLLVNIFPISSASKSQRVFDLISGYGRFSAGIHPSFYEAGQRQVECFPAQSEPTKNDVMSLQRITDILKNDLGIRR